MSCLSVAFHAIGDTRVLLAFWQDQSKSPYFFIARSKWAVLPPQITSLPLNTDEPISFRLPKEINLPTRTNWNWVKT